MPEINIKIRDKRAGGTGTVICDNSDYTVVWDLDGEWTPYDTKTMRVNLADGTYQDVVFTGDTATLPVLTASGWVSVGLYAGDLHTSRAARLLALSSVLTSGGSPAAPAEDVYAQIMAKLNELSAVSPEDIAKAVEDYLTEHPAASASMRVEGGYIQFSADGKTWENVIALADLKGPKGDTGAGMDVTGATVGQIAVVAAVDASGVPTAWKPADMAGVGEREWNLLGDITLTEDASVISITKTPDGQSFSIREISFFGTIFCDQVQKTLQFSSSGVIAYGNPMLSLGSVLNAADGRAEHIASYIQVFPECMVSRTQHNQYNSDMGYNDPVFSACNLRDDAQVEYSTIGDPITKFAIGAWNKGASGFFKAGTHLKFYGR